MTQDALRRNRIYVPSSGPSDWRSFLAEPERQWRTGYSARALAHCWEAADGLPPEIAALFDPGASLLLAFPEHKVPLPGGRTESQSDVFALIRHGDRISATTIEGKVDEPFGGTLGEWLIGASPGKLERLKYLCTLLGIDRPPPEIRYQLLHRTASAVIEAARFKAYEAATIVHSFSPSRKWFADFERFSALFGCNVEPDRSYVLELTTGQALRIGWATGDPGFLAA